MSYLAEYFGCAFLQPVTKKLLLYGGILFIWIFIPIHQTTLGILSTDIIKGICIPWGAFSSYAAAKTIPFLVLFDTYLVPMIAMLFCYYRIVYTIRNKVSPAL